MQHRTNTVLNIQEYAVVVRLAEPYADLLSTINVQAFSIQHTRYN